MSTEYSVEAEVEELREENLGLRQDIWDLTKVNEALRRMLRDDLLNDDEDRALLREGGDEAFD